ncbi:exopolyphosphatase [Kordiimonas sediminis]|uniref:Exopolyphosphatase n=1 Tax=Kordiimonas sediminis TaxID=1735581 RepID=A0A919AVT1_9PROT|nr:Ppx/GppA phosphatase family protein [Kordiimonas sediminis]GHF27206.1 exopolyphosphatase [Kordiimonas sediminis]
MSVFEGELKEQSPSRQNDLSERKRRSDENIIKSEKRYPAPKAGVGPAPIKYPGNKAVYSAIDLGTNNCRLLVAKPVRQGFRVIDAYSRIVRLGEGIATSGRLSNEAMDRSIEALKVCADKIAHRNVTCMRHVATEACRIADNSDEFVERVKSEAGLNIDIISAAEEARLAVMGCQSLIAPGNKHALVFDIGGGSTELIYVKVLPGRRTEILGWMSIPWGVVNLTETFQSHESTLDPAIYHEMINEVDHHLIGFETAYNISDVVRRKQIQFLGTSGTVTTLASLQLKLPRYIRSRVDGAWMDSERIKELSRKVSLMSYQERIDQPCIGKERADLVIAGCAILEAILNRWHVSSLRVADRGIREGILRGLMQVDMPPRTRQFRGSRQTKR